MKRSTADELLKTARERFDRAITAESKNRAAALDDLLFYAGEQWDETARAMRLAASRPCLTVNKLPVFLHQITNDQRQNRPSINISPLGGQGSKKTADMLKGLIRQIERESDADGAYDSAFFNAVCNGFGYWRIVTEYESEDSFDQVIRVKRIRNPFTVYMDPDRQECDGSDAKWAFITEMVPRSEFEAEYPNKRIIEWQTAGVGDEYRNWYDQKDVRVAEYFVVETKKRTLVHLDNGHVGYLDVLADEILAKIKMDPEFIIDEREAECRTVMWYKISGTEILDEREWVGSWIPIVECIGEEVDVEGKVIKRGMVREAKDPQRMKNYWSSSAAELVALQPKTPYVIAEGQIEGYESIWRTANTESRPYLTYKPLDISGKLVPPPQRQAWAGPPSGAIALEQQSEQDLMATTGVRFDATKSERIADESGVALKQLSSNQQLGAYHYIDNLARSEKFGGKIILDIIPRIYTRKRIVTILKEDGEDATMMVDPQAEPFSEVEHEGETIKCINPQHGKYNAIVTIGPNYQTRMEESSAGMMEFGKSFPMAAQYIADLVAKNQPWPESDVIAKRLAMTLPPMMNQPDQSDMSPQAQAFIGSLTQQLQQMQQERAKLIELVQDKTADREVEQQKNDQDFEAKMTKIIADLYAKSEQLASARDQKMVDAIEERFALMIGAQTDIAVARESAKAKPNGESK